MQQVQQVQGKQQQQVQEKQQTSQGVPMFAACGPQCENTGGHSAPEMHCVTLRTRQKAE